MSPTLEARLGTEAVRDVYSKLAPVYPLWARVFESRARARAIELAAVRDGESLLEIAVGPGITFEELVRRNPSGQTEGIDLTPAMVERTRVRMKAASLPGAWSVQVGDARHLPFADGSFDLVHNAYMFDLLPEEEFPTVLREMHRVLRPGGRLVLVNLAQGTSPLERIPEAIYRIRPAWMGGCRGVALEAQVAQSGFTQLSRKAVVQLGFPSEIVVAEKAL